MKIKKKYSGVVVPMITPLMDDLSIDVEAVNRIVDLFVENKVCAFLSGTTGEAPSLSIQQKDTLVQAAVKRINGRDLVYAGISSNCINDSINDAHKYFNWGVDVVVATLPAYYPMNNDQMYNWFAELAEKVNGPLIIYNMPATVKYSIPLEVIEKLSHISNVVGLKDSERDEERMRRAIEICKNREDFSYLLGWAAQSSNAMLLGADGIVPSTGNFAPKPYRKLVEYALVNDKEGAERCQSQTDYLGSLYQKDRILSESIPALKAIMSVKRLCKTNVMPPMYKISFENEKVYMDKIKKELEILNI